MKKVRVLLLVLMGCLFLTGIAPIAYADTTQNKVDVVEEGSETPSTEEVKPEKPTKTGWFGDVYYVKNEDGKLVKAKGVVKVDGKYLYFKSGKVDTSIKGLKKYQKRYYYFKKGVGAKPNDSGLKKIDGSYYAFASTGRSYTGSKTYDKLYYHFDKTGKGAGGWFTVNKNKYYALSSGKAATGWKKLDGYYYYFSKTSGKMQKNKVVDQYKLDSKGHSKTKAKIMEVVKKYTNSDMTKAEKMKALWYYMQESRFKYVRNEDHLAAGWNWPSGWCDSAASRFFRDNGGNCFSYACTYAFLVKEATGYPVRAYHGETPSRYGGLTAHGWSCVKISGTWYVYDPDFYKYCEHDLSLTYKSPYSKRKKDIHRNGKYSTL